jgi:hypothetical protein
MDCPDTGAGTPVRLAAGGLLLNTERRAPGPRDEDTPRLRDEREIHTARSCRFGPAQRDAMVRGASRPQAGPVATYRPSAASSLVRGTALLLQGIRHAARGPGILAVYFQRTRTMTLTSD